MEEFSRREFVKRSAAGIVLAGSGTLLGAGVASATNAKASGVSYAEEEKLRPFFPPYTPERINGRIYCKSLDPNPDREYSALIHVRNGVELYPPVLWGVDFDPFDGSSVETDTREVSQDNYYMCRAVIAGVPTIPYCETGVTCPPVLTANSLTHNIGVPRPPAPELHSSTTGHGNINIFFGVWEPEWVGTAQGEIAWIKVKRLIFEDWLPSTPSRPAHAKWEKLQSGNSGRITDRMRNKSYLINDTQRPQEIFNRSKIKDRNPSTHLVGYMAEIMYDFGEGVAKELRYRGSVSEPLIVNASTGKPIRRP